MFNMKKTLTALMVLAGFSLAGTAAADDYAGIYTTGVQYQSDLDATSAYRVGVGFNDGFNNLGISADYLKEFGANPLGAELQPYWGAGAGLGLEDGVSLSPHAFAGISYNLTPQASIYGELGASYMFYFDKDVKDASGFEPYYRAGVNFNLR